MKITRDTRINAILLQYYDKDIVLYSQDQNMTLCEYIKLSFNPFLNSNGKMPNPNQILDFDFNVEDVFVDEIGHRFTTLVSKTPRGVCSVVKLDLATP